MYILEYIYSSILTPVRPPIPPSPSPQSYEGSTGQSSENNKKQVPYHLYMKKYFDKSVTDQQTKFLINEQTNRPTNPFHRFVEKCQLSPTDDRWNQGQIGLPTDGQTLF